MEIPSICKQNRYLIWRGGTLGCLDKTERSHAFVSLNLVSMCPALDASYSIYSAQLNYHLIFIFSLCSEVG